MTEHFGNLNLYGDNIPMTTDNTRLYLHREEDHIDHVYLNLPERYDEGENARGLYLWKSIGKTAALYAMIAEALEQEAEARISIEDRATEPDREEYANSLLRYGDPWDTLPEQW